MEVSTAAEMDLTNHPIFEVGRLAELFDSTPESALIDKLLTFECFVGGVDAHFVALLKKGLPEIVSRVCIAVDSIEEGQVMKEEIWSKLCEEPKNKLRLDEIWYVDDKKKANLKTPGDKVQENANRLMEAIYYCVFVAVLWCHPMSHKRYQAHILSFASFYQRYSTNLDIMSCKDYGMASIHNKNAEWRKLFWYRNVFILTSAISPYPRQKGLFMKIASILVEGRLHSTGGGQSFAANRIAFLYAIEGATFNCQMVRKRYRPPAHMAFVPYRTETMVTMTGKAISPSLSEPGICSEHGGRDVLGSSPSGATVSVSTMSKYAASVSSGEVCGSYEPTIGNLQEIMKGTATVPVVVRTDTSSVSPADSAADHMIKTFIQRRQHQQLQRLQRKQLDAADTGTFGPSCDSEEYSRSQDSTDFSVADGEYPRKKFRAVADGMSTEQPMSVNMFYHNLNQQCQLQSAGQGETSLPMQFSPFPTVATSSLSCRNNSFSDLSVMSASSGSTDNPCDRDHELSSVTSEMSGDETFTQHCVGVGVGAQAVQIIQQFHKPVIPEAKQKKALKEPKPPKPPKQPKEPKISAKELKRLEKEADDHKVADMLLMLGSFG